MSNTQVVKTKTTPVQTAVIRFLPDGTLDIRVSGIAGITARMLDNVATRLYQEVNRLRAVERNKDLQARLKVEAETKATEEATTGVKS